MCSFVPNSELLNSTQEGRSPDSKAWTWPVRQIRQALWSIWPTGACYDHAAIICDSFIAFKGGNRITIEAIFNIYFLKVELKSNVFFSFRLTQQHISCLFTSATNKTPLLIERQSKKHFVHAEKNMYQCIHSFIVYTLTMELISKTVLVNCRHSCWHLKIPSVPNCSPDTKQKPIKWPTGWEITLTLHLGPWVKPLHARWLAWSARRWSRSRMCALSGRAVCYGSLGRRVTILFGETSSWHPMKIMNVDQHHRFFFLEVFVIKGQPKFQNKCV